MISCEINTASASEQDSYLTEQVPPEVRDESQKIRTEERLVLFLKDAKGDNPPKRLDLSGLMPEQENEQPGVPSLKIRSGSLSEMRDMEILLGAKAPCA